MRPANGGVIFTSFSGTASITPGAATLFMGACIALTAFPMLARIINERGLANSALGTLTLTAGAFDDAVSWCVLAIVLATFGGGPGVALIAIGYIVLRGMMEWLLKLPFAPPEAMGAAFWHGVKWIAVWTIAVFFFVSALDAWYQKFSYTKKLRMSRRDIRQEVKENEGDPYVKQRRRQLHQEWAQQNMLSAVRKSNVVVTNPTHIAVALQYEPGETDLPVVVAKGEGHFAELIKKTAEEEGIPILQNVPLARGLNEHVQIDDYIGNEFFDAVAEVLHWAENVRRERGDEFETVYREAEPE